MCMKRFFCRSVLVFLYVALLFPVSVFSQNLLMNGSFEEENICTEFIKNCAPEGWISTSLKSDYYFDDVKHAFDGQHFVGLVIPEVYGRRPSHFLRSRILCRLRKDAVYHLEFYIRSAHNDLDSVGVYFSPDDILYRKEGMRNATPQLWITSALPSRETNEWQKLAFLYKATGEEQFISIGSFKTQGHRYPGRPDLGSDFYFFIDKISLTPMNAHEKICAEAETIRAEEYEMDLRHGLLEKIVYRYKKSPPVITTTGMTLLQQVDTLIIPDVLFATNSYALNKNAHSLLDSFITRIHDATLDSVVIEGHTDSTGSGQLNKTLSVNRAESVAAYVEKHIGKEIITRGRASERPVADNRTPSGRQLNRRVEIYLYYHD